MLQDLKGFAQFISVERGLMLFMISVGTTFLMGQALVWPAALFLGVIVFCIWSAVDAMNNICDVDLDVLSDPVRAKFTKKLGKSGFFIAFAFSGVSKQVASWKYGVVAIVTLLFDVLVPVGGFAALGHFAGAEVDSLFIVALLTILGISINDKIVVFDRIRENLQHSSNKDHFDDVVSRSIRQTLARSINTSLTVVIMLLALYFYGPAATQVFALTLTVGMGVGTYSSIFFASPLLVAWEKWQKKA